MCEYIITAIDLDRNLINIERFPRDMMVKRGDNNK